MPVYPGGLASPLIPTSVSIDPADSRHVFVVSSPRTGGYFCFGTIDGGASWIQSTTSLTAIAFDPSSLGVVYAVATDSSLLKSTDNGASFLSVKIVGPGPLYVYAVWADAR